MNKNKQFAELFGISFKPGYYSTEYHTKGTWIEDNPDFAADPREVLKAMQEKSCFYDFVLWTFLEFSLEQVAYWLDFYILDTTGKIRDLGISFMEGRKG